MMPCYLLLIITLHVLTGSPFKSVLSEYAEAGGWAAANSSSNNNNNKNNVHPTAQQQQQQQQKEKLQHQQRQEQNFRTIVKETKMEEEHYSIRRVAGSREDYKADIKGKEYTPTYISTSTSNENKTSSEHEETKNEIAKISK